MWLWFWRSLGILAAFFMIAMLILFWTAWHASSFTPIADGREIKSGIDVISIQLDILSLVIAVAGIGLAVMGIFGYQSIKAGAEAAAIKVATAKADQVATDAVALHMQAKAGTNSHQQLPVEPTDFTELTEEEKGD